MAKKNFWLGMLAALTFSMAFAGCSTFPTLAVIPGVSYSYTILGYVGDSFNSYEEAFAAAKLAYPTADAVVAIKGTADDYDLTKMHLFSKPIILGYYAVNFKEKEIEPRKKIFGIF
ncbi:MAG: hypothetical protein LBC27_02045 [Spirochaetaceae bacterium]|jgi:hypothetical protein|nr:hypothetical protein [Spirochaetaceae bacterium]